MKFALSQGNIRYSPAERELFKLIPYKPNMISTVELTRRRYGTKSPYHGVSIVGNTMRSLARKVEVNQEPFQIAKTAQAGPHPVSYWLEERRW